MTGADAAAAVETVAADAAQQAASQTAAAVAATVAATETEAAAAVTAAEAAVALANASAAAAELDAAERVRNLVEGLVSWQMTVQAELAALLAAVQTLQAEMTATRTLASEASSATERLLLIQPPTSPGETPPVTVIEATPQNVAVESPVPRTEPKPRRWI